MKKITKKLTKKTILGIRKRLEEIEFLPYDRVFCYYLPFPDEESGDILRVCHIDFIKGNKIQTISLAPDREYNCESIKEQLVKEFGGKNDNN